MLGNGKVFFDLSVDDFCYFLLLTGGEFIGMTEIKAETLASDVAACLLDVVAEDLSEGLVEEVGGGVIFDNLVGVVL